MSASKNGRCGNRNTSIAVLTTLRRQQHAICRRKSRVGEWPICEAAGWCRYSPCRRFGKHWCGRTTGGAQTSSHRAPACGVRRESSVRPICVSLCQLLRRTPDAVKIWLSFKTEGVESISVYSLEGCGMTPRK